MEKNKQERVLAYTLSTPINQQELAQVTGGSNANGNWSGRVVITGDHTAPDVVIEI
jgi:hypothetical protein